MYRTNDTVAETGYGGPMGPEHTYAQHHAAYPGCMPAIGELEVGADQFEQLCGYSLGPNTFRDDTVNPGELEITVTEPAAPVQRGE